METFEKALFSSGWDFVNLENFTLPQMAGSDNKNQVIVDESKKEPFIAKITKESTNQVEINQELEVAVANKEETSSEPTSSAITLDFKTLSETLEGKEPEISPNKNLIKEDVVEFIEGVESSRVLELFDGSWVERRQKEGRLKILVVGDIELESGVESEGLDGESYTLLGKMFSALGMGEGHVGFCQLIETKALSYKQSKNLNNFVLENDVELIFTLGAAPLRFFEFKERLTKLHGKKEVITIGSKSIGVIPIFHPEYLIVNPNMKKRVWDDIKYLKQ